MTIALKTKSGATIGVITKVRDGFRFIPHTDAHKPSRKSFSTRIGCVPAWAQKIADFDQIVAIKKEDWENPIATV